MIDDMISSAYAALAKAQPVVLAGANGTRAGVTMSDHHIVIVDDEQDVRETVEEYLHLHGFRVSTADGGPRLREIIDQNGSVDVVLLDINMPGEDGLSLARYLREHSDTGIIMLTASGEVIDRIVGLEIGADDYLGKPVDLRELLARIKALLRRLRPAGEAAAATPCGPVVPGSGQVTFGICQLDLDAHKLVNAAGEEVPLTSMEFDLLKAFAEHPNRVLTRDQLLDMAHSRDWEPFDRSIDVRIARIRRKVEKDPSKPQVIKTIRGAGYMFAAAKA
jgi:DNA-binding response OmpR family regulator